MLLPLLLLLLLLLILLLVVLLLLLLKFFFLLILLLLLLVLTLFFLLGVVAYNNLELRASNVFFKNPLCVKLLFFHLIQQRCHPFPKQENVCRDQTIILWHFLHNLSTSVSMLSCITSCGWPPLSKALCLLHTFGWDQMSLLKVRYVL